jgi:phospholipase/carboxylesterase
MHRAAGVWGGLNCLLVDDLPPGAEPSLLVVFCHGFGAPGGDLVPLGPELLGLRPELAERVRFVFPAAPLSLAGMYGGRAWWLLDVLEINAAIQRGELRDLRGKLPDGMPEACKRLDAAVMELLAESGLPASRLVLGGFSQGSMVATDVALRMPDAPAGLCVFSGTLVCEDQWRPLAEKRKGLPVLQSHGRQDPILPFRAAEWLRDMLIDAGCDVDFVAFNGPHTIPAEALIRCAAMLAKLV